jgi:hypothetical protein
MRKATPKKHGQKMKGEATKILSADRLGFDVRVRTLIVLLWPA